MRIQVVVTKEMLKILHLTIMEMLILGFLKTSLMDAIGKRIMTSIIYFGIRMMDYVFSAKLLLRRTLKQVGLIRQGKVGMVLILTLKIRKQEKAYTLIKLQKHLQLGLVQLSVNEVKLTLGAEPVSPNITIMQKIQMI
ncbi:hypothetical protein BWD08_05220 [Neisseria animaloris]|nr:hypothetical protein BWD08_05220 [Neisseria animaloris]